MSEEAPKVHRRRQRAAVAEEDDGGASLPAGILSEQPTETRSMRAVSRAILRSQSRALIFERLKAVTAEYFRGTETRPARLLLKVPGSGAFPAEFDDVVEVENELAELAARERAKIGRLLGSGVLADPSDVDRGLSFATPRLKPPVDEGVETNPAFAAKRGG